MFTLTKKKKMFILSPSDTMLIHIKNVNFSYYTIWKEKNNAYSNHYQLGKQYKKVRELAPI